MAPSRTVQRFVNRGLVSAFALAAVLLSGCYATHIRTDVPENPLPKIAKKAAPQYKVSWDDENVLHLREVWPIGSIFSLGLDQYHALLRYHDGVLTGKFWLQMNALTYLWLPAKANEQDMLVGQTMRQERERILRWGGIKPEDVTATNGSFNQ